MAAPYEISAPGSSQITQKNQNISDRNIYQTLDTNNTRNHSHKSANQALAGKLSHNVSVSSGNPPALHGLVMGSLIFNS